jgi:diguanylate cyclase (GGDEF)-like protein/putative nucleotidyltransferase with HDIG domain
MYGFEPTAPPPPYTEHSKLFTPESWVRLSSSLEYTKKSGIPYELELESVAADGKHGWMWVKGEAIKDSNGNITGIRGAAQDITERKKTESKLLYLINYDHLTELHNRRFLEENLMRLDTIENLPLSIIMCDVNGLKLVNDSFGHDVGDALLKKTARIIQSVCREEDIVARVGGDEFIVALPQTTAEETLRIANRIKELASTEKVANIELSISYGHDTKATDNQSIVEVMANAENHMHRQKLYERSSVRSKTIDLIMNTLFEKSNREAMHSNRVSRISQAIASKMNFSKDAVQQMKIAGLIHDIGKIGVDENILNKPGRLTVDERRDMERHPEIGWKILSSANEFLELAQFVLNHHERWDGSGYPNGLKGEEIQLEARIISVADAYDAMTSERSYKKGMCQDEAVKELQRCSGTQFDPEIVDVFIHLVLPETGDYR